MKFIGDNTSRSTKNSIDHFPTWQQKNTLAMMTRRVGETSRWHEASSVKPQMLLYIHIGEILLHFCEIFEIFVTEKEYDDKESGLGKQVA